MEIIRAAIAAVALVFMFLAVSRRKKCYFSQSAMLSFIAAVCTLAAAVTPSVMAAEVVVDLIVVIWIVATIMNVFAVALSVRLQEDSVKLAAAMTNIFRVARDQIDEESRHRYIVKSGDGFLEMVRAMVDNADTHGDPIPEIETIIPMQVLINKKLVEYVSGTADYH
jgi:hypothetical protein